MCAASSFRDTMRTFSEIMRLQKGKPYLNTELLGFNMPWLYCKLKHEMFQTDVVPLHLIEYRDNEASYLLRFFLLL